MINLLHRYLIKRVLLSVLLLLLIIGVLSWIINFLGEMRDLNGDYGFFEAMVHAGLELPFTLNQFFPMIALLGGLIGLGGLAQQGELVVMRTSGMSFFYIIFALFFASLILSIMSLLIGEVIAPRLHYLADTSKSSLQSNGQTVITATGVWFHQQNNFIHVEKVLKHRQLQGVTRYTFVDHQLLSSAYAESVVFTHGQWIAKNLSQTFFNKNGERATSQHLAETIWHLKLNPSILNSSLIEPEEISLNHLFDYVKHLNKEGAKSSEFQFSFWKRIFQPLTIFLMLILALPFVFVAPRSPIGWRLLVGVIVGFTFYMVNISLGQLSVIFQFSPIIAALLPMVLFTLLGYGFFKWRVGHVH